MELNTGIVGNYFVVQAVVINDIDDIEVFQIGSTPGKYYLIKKRLENEYRHAVRILQKLKKDGLIHSVSIPKNRSLQKKLDEIVNAKKIIRNSIKQLKDFYT